MVIAGFLGIANERAVDGWDANLHLLMKLFGSSLAVGLERVHDNRCWRNWKKETR